MSREVWIDRVKRYLRAGIWVYFTILFGWVIIFFVTGDQIGYIALFNSLAVYLFFPLLLIFPLALFLRRREIWVGLAIGLLVFIYYWGELFVPRVNTAGIVPPALTVMTYNVLGNQNQTPPLISVIRHENPDVLFIQELNPDLALVLEDELLYQYPYQILAPERGVRGMGVISKFPLEESGSQLPLGWVGKPQLINMNWQGQEVILVNFHMFPSGIGSPDRVAEVFRAREEQARVLAAFASQARVHHPIVVAGDANVTDLSQAYKILSEELSDAWRQAGSGFGHTFPGSDGPGSSRPRIAGWSVPRWLARIDYIFFSQQWEILTARLAQVDGVSDHRGVIAVLVLE